MMTDEVAILKTMYERFNARDIDGVLVAMDGEVEWANGMDGGHVHGKDGVRDYWQRQWAQVSPRVEPLSFDGRADGRIAVEVRLELFDLTGQPLASQGGLQSHVLHHVYTFDGGVITRFDIEEADTAPAYRPEATTPEALLRRAFDAFNRQDADDLLMLLSDDVSWSSDVGVLNKDALRDFWSRTWSKIRTHDEVTHVERVTEDDYIVSLDQEIHSLDGSLISSRRFTYSFVVKNGQIAALRAREPLQAGSDDGIRTEDGQDLTLELLPVSRTRG